jgi:hypothetical protein
MPSPASSWQIPAAIMETCMIAFVARTTMKTSMITGIGRAIAPRVLSIPDCPEHLLARFKMSEAVIVWTESFELLFVGLHEATKPATAEI